LSKIASAMIVSCFALGMAACVDTGVIHPQAAAQTYTRAELLERMRAAGRVSMEGLQLSEADVEARFREVLRGQASPSEAELLRIAAEVNHLGPDFSELGAADLEMISRDLGGMPLSEVEVNMTTIRDLYLARMRFEAFTRVSALVPAIGRNEAGATLSPRFNITGPTLEELLKGMGKFYLYPAMVRARDEAFAFTREYGLRGDGEQGNAYQHAIWNVLIVKYTGWSFHRADEAVAWAKKMTDAHEYGAPAPQDYRDRTMDLHNNNVGLSIARAHAYSEFQNGVWQVGMPDVSLLKALVRAKTDKAVKFSQNGELSSITGSSVFFRIPPRVAVHRLFNPAVPDHFYTRTSGEGTNAGWRTEANNYLWLSSGYSISYATLYRCWVAGRHYVSLDPMCEANVRAEGELGRVANTQHHGTRPLYRLINPQTRDRLTTWSAEERDKAVNQYNYRFERITGYAWLARE
jgi:hypothetical protein